MKNEEKKMLWDELQRNAKIENKVCFRLNGFDPN